MNIVRKRPFTAYFLAMLIFIEAAGALYGGISLVCDPSGQLLHLSLSFLNNTPFKDYLIPGIVLLLTLGIFPIITFFALLFNLDGSILGILNIYPTQEWRWTYSLYTGIILTLWIVSQIMFIGYWHPIQAVFAYFGILIIIVALLPQVKDYFSKQSIINFKRNI